MKVDDLPDKPNKLFAEKIPQKRLTPKKVFLQFLDDLFAASLLGRVDWWPDSKRADELAFRAEFGRAVVRIALCEGTYLAEVVFPTEMGNFSIDGETSYARVGTFASVFWAAIQSFEVRRMLNRKALPSGDECEISAVSLNPNGMSILGRIKKSHRE